MGDFNKGDRRYSLSSNSTAATTPKLTSLNLSQLFDLENVAETVQEKVKRPITKVHNRSKDCIKDRLNICSKSEEDVLGVLGKPIYQCLPRMVWTPENHHLFPPSFQKAIYTYLCCHYKGITSAATGKRIECEKSCKSEVRGSIHSGREHASRRNHLAVIPTSLALHIITF